MYYTAKSPRVISEVIDGEAIIIDMATGNYYSSLGVGARVWEAASVGEDIDAILHAISEAFPEEPDAVSATRNFIDDLLEYQLLITVESPESFATPTSFTDLQYTIPVIEAHDDMSELILLDPIHETDSAGWPTRPQPV